MSDGAPLLEIAKLRVRFRTQGALRARMRRIADPFIDAVADASLAVRARETFGLVGESGSGKTTLARAVIGLVRAQSGSVRFDGRELLGLSDSALKPVRREIAMMFQDPVASLSPRKTVRALVLEPFRIHGVVARALEPEARQLMAMVGLAPALLDAWPHQLSGGQARRVGVARALALRPRLVIADEPTAGLDVSVQGEILNLLNALQGELGLAYLIVTHNLPVIRHVSDRLAIMYLGRIVEEGPTDTVFARPAHPYTLMLLSAVPRPDPDLPRADLPLVGEVPSLRQRPTGCEFHPRCPFAQPRCRVDAPPLADVAPGRRASCHFPFPSLPT
jgi:oligopeptide/dipeptide ABC transporter ATP-binding protein